MIYMKKIALIPIDNRPVCYTLPAQIASIDKELEILMPPRRLLGDLKTQADIDGIYKWLLNLEDVDSFVISLDTIAHGGLVNSRRSTESFEQIRDRLEKFKAFFVSKNAKTYAFSSIMRISNNNINEEEKEYWNLYGKKIFDYSYNFDKSRVLGSYDDECKCNCISKVIPESVLSDYLNTRNRNFLVNKEYLKWAKEGLFDTLVYSKDDCAQYGLNVEEARALQKNIDEAKINALVKTGADEIPVSLLSRAISDGQKIKILPKYLRKSSIDKISKYEDVSVKASVEGQIELCGGAVVDKENDADLVLIVNNFKDVQGEIVMDIEAEGFAGDFSPPQKPYAIADIVFANGSDNNFIKKFFENDLDFNNFYGYAGWNTTGNTLGSVISSAIVRFLTKDFNLENFKTLQLVRFLDDFAYQANVRQELKNTTKEPCILALYEAMQPYETILFAKLELTPKPIRYNFPWNRFFEVETQT